MKLPIYLDNNSTTPLDPEVLKSMMPYLTEKYGNPASKMHNFGIEADVAVEIAREKISYLIGASPAEIIFTSGATESINLALKGFAESNQSEKIHIITTSVEHQAVLDTCKALEKFGVSVSYLPVDSYGLINIDVLKNEIKNNTRLVSINTANNEIGTIQPVAEIGEICKEHNILFHTDATQAVGKIPFDVNSLNADLVSFSAHKIYGPKGIGTLIIKNKKPKIKLTEQISGGGQEKGLRSGTLNVPAIVGFGEAARLCREKLYLENFRTSVLRDRLMQNLIQNIPGTKLNGHSVKRLPGNVSVSIDGVNNNLLISYTRDVAFSTGSACSSESMKPSHVLKAMGRSEEEIKCSIRFGIGRFNTNEEIDYVIKYLINTVKKIRK